MRTLEYFLRERTLPRLLEPLSLVLLMFAAGATAAPFHAMLGADPADDTIMTRGQRLFPPAPVFLALQAQDDRDATPLRPADSVDDTGQAAHRDFLTVPEAVTTTHDMLPSLLAALEEEIVDNTSTSFGLPQGAVPATLVAGRP